MLAAIGYTMLVVVFIMLCRVPIAYAFAAGGMILLIASDISPVWALSNALDMVLSFAFLTLPLYLFLGTICGEVGVGGRLSNFIVALIGRVKGGLGLAFILTMMIWGAISGAAIATLFGVGKPFVPEMDKNGYPRSYTAALLVAASVTDLLIPPSGTMIIFGFMGRLSITQCSASTRDSRDDSPCSSWQLFTWLCPTAFPQSMFHQSWHFAHTSNPFSKTPISPSGTFFCLFLSWAASTAGSFTPSEGASVGVIYALILGFILFRNLRARQLLGIIHTTGVDIASVAALLFFFMVIGKVMIVGRVSEGILTFFSLISPEPWFILLMICVVMFLMGMFMDDCSAMMISAVILLPIAKKIGVNPYHFASISCLNLGLGLITPPVAPLLYIGGTICEVPLHSYIKPVLMFVVFAYLPTLVLTVLFPKLSTWLPSLAANYLG